ncbi:MAG: DoxX family protein [Bacteroidales bacterium]|nr:DoxX family protein [Bacteroidales bacterium]
MNYKLIKDILRIGIGGMFVIAAILKLMSIDEFEIYIYSFNVLNFLLTSFVSRIIIAGEFILGLFLILKVNYKFTWNATMTVLILFTLFLIYVAISRNDTNCHCFGQLVELSPVESIIKNVIAMILLSIDKWTNLKPQSSKFKAQSSTLKAQSSNLKAQSSTLKAQSSTLKAQSSKFKVQSSTLKAQSLIATSTLLIVFVVSPPDVIYNKIYSEEKEISSYVLQESFDDIVKINFENDTIVLDSTAVLETRERNLMIAIVSSGCKYCHLGVKKLSMIMKRKGTDTGNVNIFIWGSDDGILNFIKETDTEDLSYWKINPRQAIEITYGRFPVFIWLEDGEIVDIGDFRNITKTIEF